MNTLKPIEDRLRMLAEEPGIDLRQTMQVLLDTAIEMTDVATRALAGAALPQVTPGQSREEYLVELIKRMLPDVRQQRERNWRSGAPLSALSDYDDLIRAAETEIKFEERRLTTKNGGKQGKTY